MVAGKSRVPRWYGIPVRVLLITFLLMLLTFAVTLLLAIVGLLVGANMRGAVPNLTLAYKYVAAPSAVLVGAVVLVSALVMEIKRYRQARTLAAIENASR